MKTLCRAFACGALLVLFLVGAGFASAQHVAELTAAASSGIISEVSPQIIVIKSESSAQPQRYLIRKPLQYVDETGAPVSEEFVKSGLPVIVHYVKDGDQLVAAKVVVRRSVAPAAPTVPEKTTTTVTTVTTAPQ
ncbi:MAG: hypothetical protein QOE70_2127 [Chthoniobacter sp.]|nr:hypothetical protein [Chthoniobacter sp.]